MMTLLIFTSEHWLADISFLILIFDKVFKNIDIKLLEYIKCRNVGIQLNDLGRLKALKSKFHLAYREFCFKVSSSVSVSKVSIDWYK